MRPPAPNPCETCPYRRDVESGVWDATEYAKLLLYDKPTGDQPFGLFQCHQHDAQDEDARVCAGWVGCHGQELIGLRIACSDARLPHSVMNYTTPVPLFESGAAAAEHGMREIHRPSRRAVKLMAKVVGRRKGIQHGL